MNSESLGPLLESLCQGDMGAAKHVYLACEAYLRKVVRRQMPPRLQSKFDSVDIVQSVWADLLYGYRAGAWHFADVRRFQAFLAQAARNRFYDKFRKHRIAVEREQRFDGLSASAVPPCGQPQPSAVVEAEELWEKMIEVCPPEHQELLRLKRGGLTMDELVASTGLHAGSIRRIFRNLARNLALEAG